jgi:hypothetical protein
MYSMKGHGSAVGIVTDYWLEHLEVDVPVPVVVMVFHITLWSRPALGPTQPLIQWGSIPGGKTAGA